MKIFSKIAALITAVGLTVGMCGTVAFADNAEKTPDGYVTVSVEKFTIGQGYVSQPKTVGFYTGETGMDVLVRAVGKENIAITEGSWGNYISGFADKDTGSVNLSDSLKTVLKVEDLTDRTTTGYLSEFDYTTNAGFSFFVNNKSSMVGVDAYAPVDGDVIRMQFSIYESGADLGTDSRWEWEGATGGSASIIPETNRDNLTVLIAKALAGTNKVDCQNAIAVISNLDSVQSELDASYSALEKAIEEDNKPVGDNKPINDKKPTETTKPAQTGLEVCLVLPIAIMAFGILFKVKPNKR
ncbi:MAG: DUF4430 domain-containing protein [Clostridiales bacterium]|nr:DUF4430 domain-containing protein [Clostridiales bacterium]